MGLEDRKSSTAAVNPRHVQSAVAWLRRNIPTFPSGEDSGEVYEEGIQKAARAIERRSVDELRAALESLLRVEDGLSQAEVFQLAGVGVISSSSELVDALAARLEELFVLEERFGMEIGQGFDAVVYQLPAPLLEACLARVLQHLSALVFAGGALAARVHAAAFGLPAAPGTADPAATDFVAGLSEPELVGLALARLAEPPAPPSEPSPDHRALDLLRGPTGRLSGLSQQYSDKRKVSEEAAAETWKAIKEIRTSFVEQVGEDEFRRLLRSTLQPARGEAAVLAEQLGGAESAEEFAARRSRSGRELVLAAGGLGAVTAAVGGRDLALTPTVSFVDTEARLAWKILTCTHLLMEERMHARLAEAGAFSGASLLSVRQLAEALMPPRPPAELAACELAARKARFALALLGGAPAAAPSSAATSTSAETLRRLTKATLGEAGDLILRDECRATFEVLVALRMMPDARRAAEVEAEILRAARGRASTELQLLLHGLTTPDTALLSPDSKTCRSPSFELAFQALWEVAEFEKQAGGPLSSDPSGPLNSFLDLASRLQVDGVIDEGGNLRALDPSQRIKLDSIFASKTLWGQRPLEKGLLAPLSAEIVAIWQRWDGAADFWRARFPTWDVACPLVSAFLPAGESAAGEDGTRALVAAYRALGAVGMRRTLSYLLWASLHAGFRINGEALLAYLAASGVLRRALAVPKAAKVVRAAEAAAAARARPAPRSKGFSGAGKGSKVPKAKAAAPEEEPEAPAEPREAAPKEAPAALNLPAVAASCRAEVSAFTAPFLARAEPLLEAAAVLASRAPTLTRAQADRPLSPREADAVLDAQMLAGYSFHLGVDRLGSWKLSTLVLIALGKEWTSTQGFDESTRERMRSSAKSVFKDAHLDLKGLLLSASTLVTVRTSMGFVDARAKRGILDWFREVAKPIEMDGETVPWGLAILRRGPEAETADTVWANLVKGIEEIRPASTTVARMGPTRRAQYDQLIARYNEGIIDNRVRESFGVFSTGVWEEELEFLHSVHDRLEAVTGRAGEIDDEAYLEALYEMARATRRLAFFAGQFCATRANLGAGILVGEGDALLHAIARDLLKYVVFLGAPVCSLLLTVVQSLDQAGQSLPEPCLFGPSEARAFAALLTYPLQVLAGDVRVLLADVADIASAMDRGVKEPSKARKRIEERMGALERTCGDELLEAYFGTGRGAIARFCAAAELDPRLATAGEEYGSWAEVVAAVDAVRRLQRPAVPKALAEAAREAEEAAREERVRTLRAVKEEAEAAAAAAAAAEVEAAAAARKAAEAEAAAAAAAREAEAAAREAEAALEAARGRAADAQAEAEAAAARLAQAETPNEGAAQSSKEEEKKQGKRETSDGAATSPLPQAAQPAQLQPRAVEKPQPALVIPPAPAPSPGSAGASPGLALQLSAGSAPILGDNARLPAPAGTPSRLRPLSPTPAASAVELIGSRYTVLCVLDTSVLLDSKNLNAVENMAKLADKVLPIVPEVALFQLENKKKEGDALSSVARYAIDVLNKLLRGRRAAGEGAVEGRPPGRPRQTEVARAYGAGDAAIFDLCCHLEDRYPEARVVLLTLDKGIGNYALAQGRRLHAEPAITFALNELEIPHPGKRRL